MVWPAIIAAAAQVGAAAMQGGGSGSMQAAPSTLTNGGVGGFDSSNWSVVTGTGNKQDAVNSKLPTLDWKLVAVLGLASMLLWKSTSKRR